MRERKSLSQMAAEAAQGEKPLAIAGKPADKCPYCGCGMFKDGVNRSGLEIVRYVECRNRNCRRRFLSSQPPEKLVREISREDSASGEVSISIHRETA